MAHAKSLGFILFLALNLSFSANAEASCLDLLRTNSAPISELSAERALIRSISESAPQVDLFAILAQEFKVEAFRFGSQFKISSWPYRVLTLKKPVGSELAGIAAYTLEFSRFLVDEKRRQLRFVLRPDKYLNELEQLTNELEKLAYPALAVLYPDSQAETSQRFGALRMSLRSLLMIPPSSKQLWPLTGGTPEERQGLNFRRQTLHWGLSRTMAALYLSVLAANLSHLPESIDSFKLLYQIRGDLIELGQEMAEGVPYDRRLEREKLIAKYEARIKKLEDKLLIENVDTEKIKASIQDLQKSITSLQTELAP